MNAAAAVGLRYGGQPGEQACCSKASSGWSYQVERCSFYLVFTRHCSRGDMEAAASFHRSLNCSGDRRALAYPGHLRNPPYFDFTLHSRPGQYHGFFWFYFINEQVLRFLNRRYPRDYNTVPRLYFWLLHLVWLFPWSVYFPTVARPGYKPVDRPGRARLLTLCWAGFVMVFFTFSTTQEYYSMPLLSGPGPAAGLRRWRRREDSVRRGTRL